MVGSLPPQNRNGRELPTRLIEKQPKKPRHKGKGKDKGKGKMPASQTTLDSFMEIAGSQSQIRVASEVTDDRDESEVSHHYMQPDCTDTESVGTSE